jgi:hypothetical protein
LVIFSGLLSFLLRVVDAREQAHHTCTCNVCVVYVFQKSTVRRGCFLQMHCHCHHSFHSSIHRTQIPVQFHSLEFIFHLSTYEPVLFLSLFLPSPISIAAVASGSSLKIPTHTPISSLTLTLFFIISMFNIQSNRNQSLSISTPSQQSNVCESRTSTRLFSKR